MKAASISELKQELADEKSEKLVEICMRLARFKKENKELLTYLLFQAHDTADYMRSIKNEIDIQFETINKSNVYFIKKTLRKILRIVNKYIRYSNIEMVEAESLIHFCNKVKELGSAIFSNQVIANIYNAQVKRISKAVGTMHEDLQYDYRKSLNLLTQS